MDPAGAANCRQRSTSAAAQQLHDIGCMAARYHIVTTVACNPGPLSPRVLDNTLRPTAHSLTDRFHKTFVRHLASPDSCQNLSALLAQVNGVFSLKLDAQLDYTDYTRRR